MDSKSDEIVLIANFSLINSERETTKRLPEEKPGEDAMKFPENDDYENPINHPPIDHMKPDDGYPANKQPVDSLDRIRPDDHYDSHPASNQPVDSPGRIRLNDHHDNYPANKQPADLLDHTQRTYPWMMPRKSLTFMNRRRAVEKMDDVKKVGLSLLNYLAFGLISFLVVLQLMLLLCPNQRKSLKRKLKSKWKKYGGKRSKKEKTSRRRLLPTTSDESLETTDSRSEQMPLKVMKKRKRSTNHQSHKSGHQNNQQRLKRVGDYTNLVSKLEQGVDRPVRSKVGQQLENGDKNSSNGSDETSGDIEMNLNDEPTVDKQEEIKLKMPKGQFPNQTIGDSNGRVTPLTKLDDVLPNKDRQPIADSRFKGAKPMSPLHAVVDLEREAKLVPKLKWFKDEADGQAMKAQEPKDLKETKADPADRKGYQANRPEDNQRTEPRNQTLPAATKPEAKADPSAAREEAKNVERIPVNWLTIVGNRKVYKENVGLFEKGDKVNILTLKPPNLSEL